MKLIIVLPLILLFSYRAWAQNEDHEVELKGPVEVASVVLDSFRYAYPGVTNTTWEYGDGFFEVVFSNNGIDITVDYDIYGRVQEIETEINISQLPQSALEYIAKNYSTFRITSASKIVSANYDLNYIAQIGKDGKFWDIAFDLNGRFIKEEVAD